MAAITKTTTWVDLAASHPVAGDMNTNFTTLYAALTQATSEVSHVDGSVAFTSLAILPTDVAPANPPTFVATEATSTDYLWQHQLKAVTGTACFLHAGTHAFPSIDTLFFQATHVTATHDGLGLYTFNLPAAFPTDILSVVIEGSGSPSGTGQFGISSSQIYISRANCTTSVIGVILPSASGGTVSMNILAVGW